MKITIPILVTNNNESLPHIKSNVKNYMAASFYWSLRDVVKHVRIVVLVIHNNESENSYFRNFLFLIFIYIYAFSYLDIFYPK